MTREEHMNKYHTLQCKIRDLKNKLSRAEAKGENSSWLEKNIDDLEYAAKANYAQATNSSL